MRIKDFEKARELAKEREWAKGRLVGLADGVRHIAIAKFSSAFEDEATCAFVAVILKDYYNEEIKRLTGELAKLGVVP